MHLRINRYYVSIVVVNVVAALMLTFAIAPFESTPVTATVLHVSKSAKPTNMTLSGVPERIVIPSIKLDIDVKTGSFDTNTKQWTIGDQAAYYADYSVLPNNAAGTTLLYGHARWGIFGALPDIPQRGDAYIHTLNKLVFHYQYVSSEVVSPSNTDVFSNGGGPQLTLQTCTGTFSQNRALYNFSLINIAKE